MTRLRATARPGGLPRARARAVLGLATLASLLQVLLLAVPASAHATLEGSDPQDQATLDTPPDAVTVTFDEPVEPVGDGVRVYDADAQRIDTGPQDTSEPTEIAAGLPADLPDGGYVAVYRIVSEDSHPLGGVLTFTVGEAEAVADTLVTDLFGGGAGVFGALGPAVRALAYATTLLAAGAAAFAALVTRRPAERARASRMGRIAAVGGLVVTALAVPVQAAAIEGAASAAFDPGALGAVLGSSFGTSTLVRLIALAVLLALPSVQRRPGPAAAVGAVAAVSFALDGHQRTVEPIWLLLGGDVIHLVAAAVWFGGVVLLVSLLRRPVDDDPVAAAGHVHRFSGLALLTVVVLAAAGVAMAWQLVASPRALVSTSYGWTLVAKLVLVLVAVAIAAYNRRRLVPAITRAGAPAGASVRTSSFEQDAVAARSTVAWRRLRTTVAAEAALLLAVLGVTGALVVQQPAAEAAGLRGLYEASAPLGEEHTVEVVVDPNRVGRNAVHAYILDDTLRPAQVEDVRFECTYLPEDIGPIAVEPFPAGPGHVIANIDDLRFAGDWEVRVIVGIDEFTEASAEVVVPVAP